MCGIEWLQFTLLYFICVQAVCCYSECKKYHPESNVTRLRTTLLCGYDSSKRPNADQPRTKVNMTFFLKNIEVYETDNKLYVLHYVSTEWHDDRLQWNPNDYGSISKVKIEEDELWRPSIGLVTMKKTMHSLDEEYDSCSVYNKGRVKCLLTRSFYTSCQTDFSRWPYDTQKCEVLLAPWKQTEEEIDYLDYKKQTYKEKNDWQLQDVIINRHNESIEGSTYHYVEVIFLMSRFSAIHEYTVTNPALVLSVLNLFSSWIRPEKGCRLFMLCILLVCHLSFLHYLNVRLYQGGINCPTIVLYYRDSMAICGLSLATTLTVKKICSIKSLPPKCMVAAVTKTVGNKIGYWVLRIFAPEHMKSETEDRIWYLFGILVDQLIFLVKFIAYFVILIAYFTF